MKMTMSVDIKSLIDNKQFKLLKQLLTDQKPAKIVEMIEELPPEEKIVVFRLLHKDDAATVFAELETDERMALLNLFKEERLKDIIESMDPDDRTEVFEELPANVVRRLLSFLSPEERKHTLTLLNYPEESAGRIMTPYFLDIKKDLNPVQALKHIRETGSEKETIYTLFVIDDNRTLEGVVDLREIIFESEDKIIEDFMNKEPIFVSVNDHQEQVAKIMRDYDLLAIPVVDSDKRLVGIITIDDIVDFIEEAATEDIQKMAGMGVTETSYFHTSIWTFVKRRVSWLSILLLIGSLAAFIIEGYEEILTQVTLLAAFIPAITDMGGNAGGQISAIMIRSMALGEVDKTRLKKVLVKELIIGLILGLLVSVVLAIRVLVSTRDFYVIASLSASIAAVVLVSNLLGAVLPFFAKLIKVDPAVVSGPLITSIMDIVGMAIYFSTAMLFLSRYLPV